MLEPVALQRAGASFRVPGLFLDGRGIVVGSEAVILLPSQGQLVALLRLISSQVALSELIPTLRCEEVRSAIGSQGYLLRLRCSESRSLDLCARAATFVGSWLGVGSARHFVQYRDAAAPLGYDAQSLYSHSDGDCVLYAATSVLAYSRLSELSLLHLVQGQPLLARRSLANALHQHDPRTPLWLLLPRTLLPRILRYLWHRSIDAAAALDEVGGGAAAAAPRAVGQGLILLRVSGGLASSPGALSGLPGLRWLLPHSEQLAIELGYQHPLDLTTFAGLFPSAQRLLFLADPLGILSLPIAEFVPIERLVQLNEIALHEIAPHEIARPAATASAPAAGPGLPPSVTPIVRCPLRLVVEPTPSRMAAASIVPWAQLSRLASLLYALPLGALGSLRAARLSEGLLVLGDLSYLPIGELHYEAAAQVLVPLGLSLVPRLSPELLRAQIRADSDRLILCAAGAAEGLGDGRGAPGLPLSARALPGQALLPLGRVLSGLGDAQLRQELMLDPPATVATEPVPQAVYPSLGFLWPLWGGPRPLSEPLAALPAHIEKDHTTD
ncbi:MAG TPA: hypothetical protein PKI03_25395 [Pseudomonadota bacterium]|nr:hypothetical protein [Pseudomonadota bacterium]